MLYQVKYIKIHYHHHSLFQFNIWTILDWKSNIAQIWHEIAMFQFEYYYENNKRKGVNYNIGKIIL